jgi:hypothetical protein
MSVSYADIERARHTIRFQYAHTSHGMQVDECGMARIAALDPLYRVAIGAGYLPSDTIALCILEGQAGLQYCNPAAYWQGGGIAQTRTTLQANPSINVSGFMWCGELKSYHPADMQVYLDALAVLEAEFPAVTFVYMTSNVQIGGRDGTWVHRNNEMIRAWVAARNGVLFDFGDLDAWYLTTPCTSYFSGDDWYDGYVRELSMTFPIQCSQYAPEQCGHTTFESCELKGAAMWWLLVQIAKELPPVSVKPATWGAIKAEYK